MWQRRSERASNEDWALGVLDNDMDSTIYMITHTDDVKTIKVIFSRDRERQGVRERWEESQEVWERWEESKGLRVRWKEMKRVRKSERERAREREYAIERESDWTNVQAGE